MSIELAVTIAAVLALLGGVAIGMFIARARLGTQVLLLEERALTRESRIREMGDELLKVQEKHELQSQSRETESNLLQLHVRDVEAKLASAETQLREERKLWESKLELLNDAREKLGDAFKALSSEVLRSSNQSFLELAQETLSKFQVQAAGDLARREQAVQALVDPIHKALDKVDAQIQQVEKTRAQAYGSLSEHLGQVAQGQEKLRAETGNLVKALRAPQARGRWGEIQLHRVVEMAGMVEHCDFLQQASVNTHDGRLRPDLIVRMPGGRDIVVDAKAPLSAYLEALEAPDDATRASKLDEHARQVRAHLTKLSAKAYWAQFQPAPEFVVLFLPGESFFSAALQADPTLIEEGASQQVIVATPTTLIALLRAVHFGWRQEKVREESQKVADLGAELYDRVRIFAAHMLRVGGSLNSAVDSYNKAMGSLESRVLVSARRFKELGSAHGELIEEPEPVQIVARTHELQEPGRRASAAEPEEFALTAPPAAAPELERMPPPRTSPVPAIVDTPAPVEPEPRADETPAPALDAAAMLDDETGDSTDFTTTRSGLRRRQPMERLLAAMGRTSRPPPSEPPPREPVIPSAPSYQPPPRAPEAQDDSPVERVAPPAPARVAVEEFAVSGDDAFPDIADVLAAAPVSGTQSPSMDEILAMVGDAPGPLSPAEASLKK